MLGTKSPIYDIEHLQLFNSKTGRKLLESGGYTRIEVFPVWNRYPLHYWTRLFPIPLGLKTTLLSVLKKSHLGNIQISLPAGNVALVGFKP